MDDFWVFGYGSLMWNPGFAYEEQHHARLFGYRRSLCIKSCVYRGTPQNPGLVLGLDHGGSCVGVAFRVSDERRDEALDYLRKRELITNTYLEAHLPVRLASGSTVTALAYVVNRAHPEYAGEPDADRAARIVHEASGQAGPNDAYVLNTLNHLRDMGIRDRGLEDIALRISAIRAPASG